MAVTFIPKVNTKIKKSKRKSKQENLAKRYARLRALDREQYLEIENMLFAGEPPSAVARFLREEWGLFKDIAYITLKDYITKFKSEVIAPRGVRKTKPLTQAEVKAVSTLERTINLAEEMDALIIKQKARIEKIYKKEKAMPLLFNWFGNELKTMSDLITKRQGLDVGMGFQQRLKKGGPLIGLNITQNQMYFNESCKVNDEVASATLKAMKELHGDTIEAEFSVK